MTKTERLIFYILFIDTTLNIINTYFTAHFALK